MPKTPISYYGGKQNMLRHILPNIPEHIIYTEAFFGGGAVFFSKKSVPSEIINDLNAQVMNFYSVCKTDFDELKLKIEATVFARSTYSVAMTIYRMPHLFNKIQQAWAFYIATNMGFGCRIGSWGLDKYGKRVKAFLNKKIIFDEAIPQRLERTQIETGNAIKVIKQYDTPETFHYIDPPYIETNMGHYAGYSISEYIELLKCLSQIKGKFLLSGFPNTILDLYIQEFGWQIKSFDQPKSASKATLGKARSARKTEVLVSNYQLK
jgi:DNA adenine methylase